MPISFRDQITHPPSQKVFDFWLSNCRQKTSPTQRDLDLMLIPKLVPYCFIMDCLGESCFRYRFVGTAIDKHIGLSLTGQMMDEVRKGNLLRTLTKLFGTTHSTGRPGFATTQMPTETRDYVLYHRLSLPLSDDGQTVNKIFGAHFFEEITKISAHRPYVEIGDDDEVGQITMVFDE